VNAAEWADTAEAALDRAALRTHVANLRRKLGPAGAIKTYSGVGYRFVVTDEADDRPPLRLVPASQPAARHRQAA
jgi:DNA-binding winged helix-turn-helix (wHTH) protein